MLGCKDEKSAPSDKEPQPAQKPASGHQRSEWYVHDPSKHVGGALEPPHPVEFSVDLKALPKGGALRTLLEHPFEAPPPSIDLSTLPAGSLSERAANLLSIFLRHQCGVVTLRLGECCPPR